MKCSWTFNLLITRVYFVTKLAQTTENQEHIGLALCFKYKLTLTSRFAISSQNLSIALLDQEHFWYINFTHASCVKQSLMVNKS